MFWVRALAATLVIVTGEGLGEPRTQPAPRPSDLDLTETCREAIRERLGLVHLPVLLSPRIRVMGRMDYRVTSDVQLSLGRQYVACDLSALGSALQPIGVHVVAW